MILLTQLVILIIFLTLILLVFIGPPSSYIFDWLTMAVVILIIFVNIMQRNERDKPLEPVSPPTDVMDQDGGGDKNLLLESFGNESSGDADMLGKYMNLLQSTVTALPNNAKSPKFAETSQSPHSRKVNIIPVQEALPESILANLTLFVSTNRVNTEDVMVWKNLASSTSEKGCLVDGSVVSPDLRFNRKPTFLDNDKNRPAFHLGTGTSLTGPPSHQLGIDGNRSFGIFFVARMTLPNHTVESSTKAFQIFANTSSNNAMTLMFLPEPQVVGVRMGSGDVILGDSKDTLRKPIYPDQFYLWMVSKSYSELEVTAVNLENHRLEPITMLRATLPPMKEQLILSNLPITINSDYMWNAGLMAFGISSMKFYTKDVLDLAQHYRDVFMDMDPEVLAFKKKIRALTDKVDATKECPYNKETCLACEGAVIDWNTPDWYLGDVHPRCLRAIASFCSANPNHKRCFCWAPSKIKDKDSACRKYRSIFDGSSPEDIPKCPSTAPKRMVVTATPKKPTKMQPVTLCPPPPPPNSPNHECRCKLCKRVNEMKGNSAKGERNPPPLIHINSNGKCCGKVDSPPIHKNSNGKCGDKVDSPPPIHKNSNGKCGDKVDSPPPIHTTSCKCKICKKVKEMKNDRH